jgi:hypothetical protein
MDERIAGERLLEESRNPATSSDRCHSLQAEAASPYQRKFPKKLSCSRKRED